MSLPSPARQLRLHGQMLPFRKITGLMAEVLPNHDEQTCERVHRT